MTVSWQRIGSAAATLEPMGARRRKEPARNVQASPVVVVTPRPLPSPPGPRLLRPPRDSPPLALRDAEPDDVASKLRGMLGLPPEDPSPDEAAAFLPHSMPPMIRDLDASAWIAWCLAGLPLFAGDFPSLGEVCRESKRVTLALTIIRTLGNVSAASRMLRTSRKVVVENLPRMGLDSVRRRLSTMRPRRGRS